MFLSWLRKNYHYFNKNIIIVLYYSILFLGIEQPTGFAIDWISGNMFVSSWGTTYNYILVSNLEGEYISVVVGPEEVFQIRSLAVDPIRGQLYWSHMRDDQHVIEKSCMDGSQRSVLVSQREVPELVSPQSKFIVTLNLNNSVQN